MECRVFNDDLGDPMGPLKVMDHRIHHMAMNQNLGYPIIVGKWIYSKWNVHPTKIDNNRL